MSAGAWPRWYHPQMVTADEVEAASYFRELDYRLLRRQGRPAPDGGRYLLWEDAVDAGRSFESLEVLWRDWYCRQPMLSHHAALARSFALSSIGWSADDHAQVRLWLNDLATPRWKSGTVYRIHDESVWPWSAMTHGHGARSLLMRGRPWCNETSPQMIDTATVNPAILEQEAWKIKALESGRFDHDRADVYAAELEREIGVVTRSVLNASLPPATRVQKRTRL